MKKIFASILILSTLILAPGQIFAQTTGQTGNVSGQAGTGTQTSGGGNAASSAAGNAAGCTVGQVVGNLAKSGVSSLIDYGTGLVTTTVSDATETTKVPVTDAKTHTNTSDTAGNTNALSSKDAWGGKGGGFSIKTALPSWDSIGFCLGNAIIHYIAQSTINWINSGFDGSPTFVENPEQLFKDIADQEAGAFIQELGLGFLCSGIQPKIQLAILQQNTNKSFQNRSKCTLTNSVKNVDQFINGDFKQGGWKGWIDLTQAPQNNYIGAQRLAQEEVANRINVRQENQKLQLSWGKGYLSFQNCETDPKTGRKINCKTTTPGSLIESQVTQTFNLPKERLAIADEFDEVLTALVNQLIKTALNESLSGDSSKNQNN